MNIIKIIFAIFSKYFLRLFYDKKYLRGKWFSNGDLTGWKWAWRCLIDQKIKGYNRHIKFPVNPTTVVGKLENIEFDLNDLDNFWKSGCYYQCWNGKIVIGKGTWIAQNVGIITENHNFFDLNKHDSAKDIELGEECWIGMNSVILPGVKLGRHTIVGAGSIVTKSFEEGNCVLAGNPAKIIRELKEAKGIE